MIERRIRRAACFLGLHAWFFAYAPRGRGYVPEAFCIRCVEAAATPPAWARLACHLGVHRRQELLAPPTWRKGDGMVRGRYCIWCGDLETLGTEETRRFAVELAATDVG